MKLASLLVLAALLPAAGGKVTWVQNGLLTHPGDKGTWSMAGAISDRGTDRCVGMTR